MIVNDFRHIARKKWRFLWNILYYLAFIWIASRSLIVRADLLWSISIKSCAIRKKEGRKEGKKERWKERKMERKKVSILWWGLEKFETRLVPPASFTTLIPIMSKNARYAGRIVSQYTQNSPPVTQQAPEFGSQQFEKLHNNLRDCVCFANWADMLPKAVMNALISRDQPILNNMGGTSASTHGWTETDKCNLSLYEKQLDTKVRHRSPNEDLRFHHQFEESDIWSKHI